MGPLKPASVRVLDSKQFGLGQAITESRVSASNWLKRRLLNMIRHRISGASSPVACATITYEGSSSEVDMQKSLIKELAWKHGGIQAGSKVGKAGYDMTFAIAYLRDFAMTYGFLAESFETFAPWSKLEQIIDGATGRIFREHDARGLPGTPFVSSRVTQLYDDGACVYFYFCMNFEHVDEPHKCFAEIENAARDEILNCGGSLSHHHGIGQLRAQFMKRVNSAELNGVLRKVKDAFDPYGIFPRNGSYSSYNSVSLDKPEGEQRLL